MEHAQFIRSNPHLPVKNLRATLDYYQHHLGFSEEWTFGDKDGGISRDQLRLLFAEDPLFTEQINNNSQRLPLLWFVQNIESVYQEYKGRGISIADDLRLHPYGQREFAFIDINGYYVRVAEEVSVGVR